ncbi:hypothetical protein SODALDRAFT_346625 [Sodiomyces alkalinus F11]|uniref:Alpha/beta hydrolase fold-3 domain-containing protein n=1 Tax=Sodiomyces alkalinus (strain CBS 110278 / VKM F-3762 / F11) TaxID=1314773 RepID=A0A3N2PL06_SODAK|nr:hypothetical protein SODALDRAFT_346625 [Sodiomyces alkalinus F11]ROT35094.1 hypothetical protein SODALDRAFT_346625 [Sodiomyces alkalinus F11]
MGYLRSKLEYVSVPSNFKPGPKHGHYSDMDAEYAKVGPPLAKMMLEGWTKDMPMEQFKAMFLNEDPPVPEDCPQPGKDISLERLKVPMRDGAERELKIYKNFKAQKNAALVYKMHGGGWTVGSHEIDEAENRYIAGLTNVVVVSIDYRMAPEFPFPYALHDSVDGLLWCKAHASKLGINPERIIVGGCSAGGNLSAALSIVARNDGITGIVAQHLSIPVTCHPALFDKVPDAEKYELLSYIQNKDADLVNAAQMEFFWDCYTGKDTKLDVLHSPLLSRNLSGLPPAMVQVAGLDPLRDEGIAYAEALKAHGVPTTLHVYKGVPHGFYGFPTLDASKQYFSRLVEFVERHAKGLSSKL